MATAGKNLSEHERVKLRKVEKLRIAIVTANWNTHITQALEDGAMECLLDHGILPGHIYVQKVPGSFELPLAAQWLATEWKADAVLALGCLIKGETPHFEFISEAVAHGLMDLNLKHNKPFVFGVITVLNKAQALDRAGGKHGNKGTEAAATALQMLAMKQKI